MKKLLDGIVEFRKTVRPLLLDKFQELAHIQSPDALLIACSDSRVVPNLFASTNPGDVFVIRNVGNLIPPCDCDFLKYSGHSESAAIDFSLNNLPVKNIIICGHSSCGAMQALLSNDTKSSNFIHDWLHHGEISLTKMAHINDFIKNPPEQEFDKLSQLNVIHQLEHLMTYPQIQERVEKGTLRLHGWWFDIAHADVYAYHQSDKEFVLIDEKETHKILEESC